MRIRHAVAVLFAGMLVGGCFSDSSPSNVGPTDPTSGNGNPGSGGVTAFKALFVPLGGILPFPTDLYFNGSTDGTLNIPATPFLPNVVALNALDGFSTVASATARFSAPINATTIGATTVIMIEVTVDNATKATVGVRRPLVYGTDYTARVATSIDSGGSTLEVIPLRPLTPSTAGTNVGYLVVLTNGLRDTAGNAATSDVDYQAIKNAQPTCAAITNASMNGICLLTGAHLAIAGAVGVPAANVALTFSFSTLSTADSLNIVAATAAPTAIVAPFTGLNLSALSPLLPPIANVHSGTLNVRYFHSPTAPLTGSWRGNPFTAVPGAATTTHLSRFNPVPVAQANLDIPLFVTVPNALSGQTKPGLGWPVVIFQHGLRGDRTQAAAIAAAYAQAGFVVAAIDIPLHGITSLTNPLYQAGRERTFNLDVVNNATGAPGADGMIDGSGTHIINLTSLLTSRDNLRQAAADIVQLARSLPALDLDGNGTTVDIDSSRIHYSGISLGGIVGTVASALPTAIISSYLNVPGGGIAGLLRDSPALRTSVNAGLAASGINQGTTLYDQFFRDAQTVVDAGDPLNYIARAVNARPVLLSQVINDVVVPNNATQRLVNAAAFTKASAAGLTPVGPGNGRWVHYTSGSHGSLLDPTASLAVTTEMQGQAATLVAFSGANFVISNSPLLEP